MCLPQLLCRYVNGWRGQLANADGKTREGPALMKVKDWPADRAFAEALARHYQVGRGGRRRDIGACGSCQVSCCQADSAFVGALAKKY